MPEDAPQPKECKSAVKNFALCAMGSAGSYMSIRAGHILEHLLRRHLVPLNMILVNHSANLSN